MKFASILAWGAATMAIVSPISAQDFAISLSADSKNMGLCAAGDSTWAKKWAVTVRGDAATVSGGTNVVLKKTTGETYYTELNTGHTGTFFITFNVGDRTLKVVNKAYGCTWQGRS